MTENPESLLEIVARAAKKHPDNIDKALDLAEREWNAEEDAAEWTHHLVRSAIRFLIHDYRHQQNTKIRRAAGEYGQPAKVVTGQATSQSILDTYAIDCRSLGSIFGKELRDIAKEQRNKAAGCDFNARLCEALVDLVKPEQMVREAVSDDQAWRIVQRLRGGGRSASKRPRKVRNPGSVGVGAELAVASAAAR